MNDPIRQLNQIISFSAYRVIVGVATVLSQTTAAAAQSYQSGGYELAGEEYGPSMFARLMTSPGATLLMVLIGAAGLFNLFTGSSKKSTNADQKQLIGLGCILLVCLMVWYRFNVWNDTYRQR